MSDSMIRKVRWRRKVTTYIPLNSPPRKSNKYLMFGFISSIIAGFLFFQNQPFTDMEEIQEVIEKEIKELERPIYPEVSKTGKVLVTRNDDFKEISSYLTKVPKCQRSILEGHSQCGKLV